MNYQQLFKLIDTSNGPWIYKNGVLVIHPLAKEAETKLIKLGVYDDKGQLISQDPKIIQYYEKNWI